MRTACTLTAAISGDGEHGNGRAERQGSLAGGAANGTDGLAGRGTGDGACAALWLGSLVQTAMALDDGRIPPVKALVSPGEISAALSLIAKHVMHCAHFPALVAQTACRQEAAAVAIMGVDLEFVALCLSVLHRKRFPVRAELVQVAIGTQSLR